MPGKLFGLGRVVSTQPGLLRREFEQRPTLMLLLSNLAAQSISVALSPVLARIYSPEDFGALGGMTALVMIGVPLTSARFELSIPVAPDERIAWLDLVVTLVTIAVLTVFFGGLSYFATHLSLGQASYFAQYWYFVPLGLAGVAVYNTLAMEASRRGALKPLAVSKLSQAALGVATQLALGLGGAGKLGLLVGFLVNQTAGVVRLGRELVLGHPARSSVRWAELKAEVIRNRNFPMYSSWSATLDAASKWGLQLVVSILWSPTIGGFIFLADRIIGRPLTLLSTSLLPVYVADVSRALTRDPKQIPKHFRTALKTQLFVSSVWTIIVVSAAPWIMKPLFGSEWAESPRYVQLITIGMVPDAVVHAVSHTLQLAGQQRIESALIAAKVLAVLLVIVGGKIEGLSALETLGILAGVQLVFAIIVLIRCAIAVQQMSRYPVHASAEIIREAT